MKKLLLPLCLPLMFSSFSQRKPNPSFYTHKNFETLYDFFAYEQDLESFLEIKKGDVIADVGGGDGNKMSALAMIYDSVTFYIEDLDEKDLNQKQLDKLSKNSAEKSGKKQTNKFFYSIGTVKSTNLPTGIFDKVIMIASFHEFTHMDEMMVDICSKLKPGGKIYLMEAFCIDKIIRCEEGHRGYYLHEIKDILKKQDFHLVKMRSPLSAIHNHVNCFVFEKDVSKAKEFLDRQQNTMAEIQKVFLFDSLQVASDAARMKSITDSIEKKITEIAWNYPVFECWTKEIGLKWMQKKKYECAVNVLCACVKLFPTSWENHLALAQAYESVHNKTKALTHYEQAAKLNSANEICRKKIKSLKKK